MRIDKFGRTVATASAQSYQKNYLLMKMPFSLKSECIVDVEDIKFCNIKEVTNDKHASNKRYSD